LTSQRLCINLNIYTTLKSNFQEEFVKRNSLMIAVLTLGVVLFVAGGLMAGEGCPSQAAANACGSKSETA